MEKRIKEHPVLSCAIVFCICGAARWIEYFGIRTDETIASEKFLHKVFGIVVLAAVLRLLHSGWQDIGFGKDGVISGLAKGLLLGGGCFLAAYLAEGLILFHANGTVSYSFYVSGFSLGGERVRQDSLLFLVLCIGFNLINVWMEEGVFRGLFMKLLAGERTFMEAVLFIAFLFGLWHWVMPFRDYTEGKVSLANLVIMGIGYMVLAGMMSIKWSLLYQMTGTLWMGLGDHLFNITVATNLLHVISNNEADSLQVVRILIGQSLSFFIVVLYVKKAKRSIP